MTDWPAIFKDIDDGMTQVDAAKKYNIHVKSISRKKKEMKKVTSKVTKVTLPHVTPTRRQFFRVPIEFLSDYEECLHTWLSAYKRYNNGATIRRRERINEEIKRLKKEVDKK